MHRNVPDLPTPSLQASAPIMSHKAAVHGAADLLAHDSDGPVASAHLHLSDHVQHLYQGA